MQSFTYLPANALGTATAADVAAGKTFSSDDGIKITGTMSMDNRVLIARKQGSSNSYTDVLDTLGKAAEISVEMVLGGNATGGKWYIQSSTDNSTWTNQTTYNQYSSAGYVRGTV